jgi:hypothetical protein
VPQVGIHAMMPLLLLAGSYTQKFFVAFPRARRMPLVYAAIGVLFLWNAKASFNLNFYRGDDPREKMVYGPNYRDVKNHLDFIREYHKIAGLKMGDNKTAVFISDYNKPEKHKDVRIYMTPIDGISWPAKWYLREIEYTEGRSPEKAINEGWEFLILAVEDADRFPQLKEKYNVNRGRATVFWMPNPIAKESILGIWKEWIPGHYLDASPQAIEAFNAKQDWYRIWRHLLMRETFEGTNRTVPSVSSIQDYLFCYRKDLF